MAQTTLKRLLSFLTNVDNPRELNLIVEDVKGCCFICGEKLQREQGRPRICCKHDECKRAYHKIRQAARRRALAAERE